MYSEHLERFQFEAIRNQQMQYLVGQANKVETICYQCVPTLSQLLWNDEDNLKLLSLNPLSLHNVQFPQHVF
jgi:hypothetical protein